MTEIAQNESVEVSVARLDERQQAMGKTISEIKDNHLVHIAIDIKELQAGQNKMQNKIAYWGGGIAAILFILQLYGIYVSTIKNDQVDKISTTVTTTFPSATSTSK